MNRIPVRSSNTRRAMRVATWDGVLASVSDNLAGPFLALFALSLGASKAQIGLVTALPTLLGTVLQIPSAVITERLKRRKLLCIAGGIGARLPWLLVALLPLLFSGDDAILAYVVVLSARAALGSSLAPAWTSLMAEMTPRRVRGSYFSNRNVLCNFAALGASLVGGLILRLFGEPVGYQVVFGIACFLGLAATYSFTFFPDFDRAPGAPAPVAGGVRLGGSLREILQQKSFVAFCLTSLLWGFGVSLPQPLFAVYFVNTLGGTAGMWGLVSGASLLATVGGQRYWGPLADHFGGRNVMAASGVFAALVPALWFLAFRAEHAFVVNAIAGFFWAGYNLSAFNLLLEVTPDRGRTTYVALFNGVVGLAQFCGPIVGGMAADAFSTESVLLASAVLRAAGLASFVVFVRAGMVTSFRWRDYVRLPHRQVRVRMEATRRRRVRGHSDDLGA